MDRINTQVIYRFKVPDNFVNKNDATVTLGWQDNISWYFIYIVIHVLCSLDNICIYVTLNKVSVVKFLCDDYCIISLRDEHDRNY